MQGKMRVHRLNQIINAEYPRAKLPVGDHVHGCRPACTEKAFCKQTPEISVNFDVKVEK